MDMLTTEKRMLEKKKTLTLLKDARHIEVQNVKADVMMTIQELIDYGESDHVTNGAQTLKYSMSIFNVFRQNKEGEGELGERQSGSLEKVIIMIKRMLFLQSIN